MKLLWATDVGIPGETSQTMFRSYDIPNIEDHGIGYRATDPEKWQQTVNTIMAEDGYVEYDVVSLDKADLDIESLLRKFGAWHRHADEEVRLILKGECYFDIRDSSNGSGRWFRVEVLPGDLVVVPAGRYHRFGLGPSNHVKAARMFKTAGGWKSEPPIVSEIGSLLTR